MKDKKVVAELIAELKSQMTTEAEIKLVNDFEEQLDIVDGEIWRDVVGYEGLYEVSNKGRVKTLLGKEGYNLKISLNKSGYYKASLSKAGKATTCLIHVLVAKAFIPNVKGKPTVNHKDGNRVNNNVENLEWATYSENLQHAYETGLRKRHYPRKNNSHI